jgi:branched-chain amino acid transport system substrate-binding protein
VRIRSRPAAVAVAALLVSFSSACGGASGANLSSGTGTGLSTSLTGAPIVIGAALARTSSVSSIGQPEITGVQLAEQYVNANGGVNGRPLDIVIQDTGGDTAGAIKAIHSLATGGKVVGIVGPSLSQQAFAADPIADRAGVPVLGPSNTAAGIPQIGPFIGRVSAPATVVEPPAVDRALQEDPTIKQVAVAYADNDAYSRSETKTFQQAVKDKGLTLATVQTFRTTDTDFTVPATAIVAAQPKLLIVSGLAVDGGSLIKKVRQLGYRGLIIGGNGLNTSGVFKPCGLACHGMLVAQAYSPGTDNATNRALVATYQGEKGGDPPQFTAQAFTAVQVMVQALATLDRREPIATMDLRTLRTKLNDQIVSGDYSTPLGLISFTPDGEVQQDAFYVASVVMRTDQTGEFSYF